MTFLGTYEHSLDAKNRLTVPAKHRAGLAGNLVLSLVPGAEENAVPSLELWKAADHESFVAAALKDLNPISPTAQKLRTMFYANAWECELDAAHRLMIPPLAKEFAGIDREVVISGAGGRLQIWNRSAFATYNTGVLAGYFEIAKSFDHTS